MVFASERDARRVHEVLPRRMGKYGLALHPEKTRLVRFTRPAKSPRTKDDRPAARSFDMLGFKHDWGRSRKGNRVVRRNTAKDRLRRAVRKLSQWCRSHRHDPVSEQQHRLCAALRGHDAYYGITDNYPALSGSVIWCVARGGSVELGRFCAPRKIGAVAHGKHYAESAQFTLRTYELTGNIDRSHLAQALLRQLAGGIGMAALSRPLGTVLTLVSVSFAGCALDAVPNVGEVEETTATAEQAATTTNGTTLNGTTLNGTTLNGTTLNGTTLNGTTLNGTTLNGTTLNGEDFIGEVMSGTDGNGGTVEVRIDDIRQAPDPTPKYVFNYSNYMYYNVSTNENADVYHYEVSWRRRYYSKYYRRYVYTPWAPICGGANESIPVKGRWGVTNPGGKDPGTSSTHITFACRGSAMAACAEDLGYKPWLSSTMDKFHRTCVRMKRADYCGTGNSYTQNGTLIDVVDNYGVQSATVGSDWVGDAEWGPDGAVCVHSSRFYGAEWEGYDFDGDGVTGTVPFYPTPECPTPTASYDCISPQKFFLNHCGSVTSIYNCADAAYRTPYLYPSSYSSGGYILNRVQR